MNGAARRRLGDAGTDVTGRGPGPIAVPRRRSLGSPRAAVGAMLVVASALGVLTLGRQHPSGPAPVVAVAARDIAPGAVLRASDLTTTRVRLTPELAARAFGDPAALVGKVAQAGLRPGDLVQASAVVRAGAAAPGFEVALALGPDRTVGGDLAVGDRVSVLATTDACTAVVAPSAVVDDVARPTSTLGGNAVVRLTVPTSDEVVAVVHALRTAQVTLTRGPAPVSGPTECAPKAGP